MLKTAVGANKKSFPHGLLVALDFDGTLFLRQSKTANIGSISEIDLSALRTVKKQIPNSHIVVASGRNLLSLCRTLGIESKHHQKNVQEHLNSSEGSSHTMSENEGDLCKVYDDLPFDYVILGAGSVTIKWPSQEIIRSTFMTSQVAFRIAQRLVLGDVEKRVVAIENQQDGNTTETETNSNKEKFSFSFFLLKGAPYMDQCLHFVCERDDKSEANLKRAGFFERLNTYKRGTTEVFEKDFVAADENTDEATLIRNFHEKHGKHGFSQFIVLFERRDDPLLAVADELVSEAVHSDPSHGHAEDVSKSIRVSHTTSPVDHKGVWLEVFPSDISKSKGLSSLERDLFLNKKDNGEAEQTETQQQPQNVRLAVGNDHNDEDMLLWGSERGRGFLVNGSPQILVDRHRDEQSGVEKVTMLKSPCLGGVAEAVERILTSD